MASYKTEIKAYEAALKTKKRLEKHTGFKWEISVWENCDWHYHVLAGNSMIITENNISSKSQFWGMVGRNGCGDSCYSDDKNKSFDSPEKCYDYELANAKKHIKKQIEYHQNTLKAITEGIRTENKY